MMPVSFQVVAMSPAPYADWFALDDAALAARGARRVVADARPGYPCRVSLEDAAPGERLLLVHHLHHDTATPYRASGPVYLREGAVQARPAPGEVPAVLRERLLSLRAYDAEGMLRRAEVVPGGQFAAASIALLEDAAIAYLHVHNAKPGCFACRVERAFLPG